MRKILIDSDVILDLFVSREPYHEEALRFFSYLETNAQTIGASASPVAIANVAYILTGLKNQRYAVGKIRELRTVIGISPMDQSCIDLALAQPYRDFEDALQYQCAVTNSIAILVTRNERDYPRGDMEILSPVEFMRFVAAEKAT